jgi:hypothetical protein
MTATHIDVKINDDSSDREPSTNERKTNISRSEGHDLVGASVFLTGDDLEKQGIDIETTDKIVVRIRDGFVLIESVEE